MVICYSHITTSTNRQQEEEMSSWLETARKVPVLAWSVAVGHTVEKLAFGQGVRKVDQGTIAVALAEPSSN